MTGRSWTCTAGTTGQRSAFAVSRSADWHSRGLWRENDSLQRRGIALPGSEPSHNKKVTGLRYWMLRLLEECGRVAEGFAADPVHDLRVALRRCRSMADGLLAMDPDPEWKAVKKAGKRLFQRLGDLRDTQVMMEWIEKLAPPTSNVARALLPAMPASETSSGIDGAEDHSNEPGDTVAQTLLQILHHREDEQKHEAQDALEEFDRKQWKQWAKSLPQRAARFRPGSALFKHLALERWTEAYRLHNLAMRHRSQTALHSTRIGIKRFRYIVENFLPVEHEAWSRDLKEMQDLLGEVHDLDVFWATAVSCKVFPNLESRHLWREKIVAERNQRIGRYRQKMSGPAALWELWRAALPQGRQVQALAMRRMKLWAGVLDPDFAHSERIATLALQLHDGLAKAGLLGSADGVDARPSLQAAALLHDVGKSQGKKGHHKASLELIRSHGTPLGWKPEDIQRAAVVARFHCGALPRKSHKALRDLLPNEQKTTIQLAAILRLANAFDIAHDGHIRKVRVEAEAASPHRVNGLRHRPASSLGRNEALVIAAEGYSASSSTAQAIAAERHLLETVLRRPVVVKAMKFDRL
jgi:CHAD domain-containing protein/HD superfamily phosphodiesterase